MIELKKFIKNHMIEQLNEETMPSRNLLEKVAKVGLTYGMLGIRKTTVSDDIKIILDTSLELDEPYSLDSVLQKLLKHK